MSNVVVLRRLQDGSLRRARPAFLFQDPKSAVPKVILPEGYVICGSPEHQEILDEIDKGA
jgi:hypothetical protein